MQVKKMLLLRPPRCLWPFLSEGDNSLISIGLPSIAGAVRRSFPSIGIKIVDCLSLKMGWRGLKKIIAAEKADIVASGEDIAGFMESVKVFQVAKDVRPETITIAGGITFLGRLMKACVIFR